MWSARSEIADLYLSGRTLALRVNGEVHSISLGEEWLASLQGAVEDHPKRRWRIWLGGRRCGLHLCEPIAGIRSIEEAELAVGASLSVDGRTVSARLATWTAAERPWLALTTEVGSIDSLMSAVHAGGGSVQSVRPWWTTETEGELGTAAMCDDEAITYWRKDESGVLTAAATLWAADDQQQATLQRLRIGGAIHARRLTFEAAPGSALPFAVTLLDEA